MKESKELILALALVGKFVMDRVKDGVQMDDAVALGNALWAEGDFKNMVMAGYKDADKIAEEFKDFSIAKALDLAGVIPELAQIIQK